MNYLVSKWAGISKYNICLTYDLLGSSEVYLMHDADMATIFCYWMRCMQSRRVFMFVLNMLMRFFVVYSCSYFAAQERNR